MPRRLPGLVSNIAAARSLTDRSSGNGNVRRRCARMLSPLVNSFCERQDLWTAEVGKSAARSVPDALNEVVREIGRVDRLHL